MSNELMTTRELEEFLRVDRTTLYHMLKEGRLPGFKVGGQWRFSKPEIIAWLGTQRPQTCCPTEQPSTETLSLESVKSAQAIFAEAMGVGSVLTRLDGQPLGPPCNSCAFCDLVLGNSEGHRRCVDSWRTLAHQEKPVPQLHQCHAGLLYARGRIELEKQFVAMIFAGQIVIDADRETVGARVDALEAACGFNSGQLRAALLSVRSLSAERAEQLTHLLERTGETLANIGQERLSLLRKLHHIAHIVTD